MPSRATPPSGRFLESAAARTGCEFEQKKRKPEHNPPPPTGQGPRDKLLRSVRASSCAASSAGTHWRRRRSSVPSITSSCVRPPNHISNRSCPTLPANAVLKADTMSISSLVTSKAPPAHLLRSIHTSISADIVPRTKQETAEKEPRSSTGESEIKDHLTNVSQARDTPLGMVLTSTRRAVSLLLF